MDISTVPTDVLQGIASGQQGTQSTQGSSQQDLSSVPTDVLQNIVAGKTPDDSDSDGDLSSLSSFAPMPQAPMGGGGNPSNPQQPSPLHFGDMLRMAALNSPQEQQNFLKSKFKFAEPELDQNGKPTGNYNVGDDPTNLSPINTNSIGNMALGLLAKGAAMLPSIAGQMRGAVMGAEAGTAMGGPAGTVIGGILGAGAGAALGEGAKNIASAGAPGFDSEKAATDTLISGLFGMGGQALGSAVQIGAKNFLAPKIASALDGAVQGGDNPAKRGAFLAGVLNFIGGVDKQEAQKGAQWGFKNIYANPKNLDPDEIHNIADDVTKGFMQKEGIAKIAYDKAEQSFAADNPNAQVKTADMLEKMTDQFGDNGLQILHKTESTMDGMSSSFQFRDDIPSDVKSALPNVKTFFTRLGAMPSDGGRTFHIPEDANTTLSGAMGAKKLFAGTFNNPNFNEGVANVMKQGLYGEGPSAQYPKGFEGLRGAIFDTAKATGHDSYIIANNNFSNLMKAQEGQLADQSGNKFTPSGWMDVKNPSSVSKYLSGINKLDYFHKQALDNLQTQIGGDFKDKASQWAVGQAMGKAKPQLLRLSVIGGLAGLAIPGSPMEKVMRVPSAFALGSPTGVRVAARMIEGGTGIGALGNKILSSFSKEGVSNTGTAALSQLLSKKVSR